ncbi:MAG: glutaminyl-peptide cyclotransferase [Pyrinomonadaceae bacterium]|nr:glutaminyl-peptide cyclotransferase [Pyrinomonadaceae bacterium]
MRFFLLILFSFFAVSCKNEAPVNRSVVNNNSAVNITKTVNQPAGKLPEYGYDIVNTYPHDPKAFTQGLVFYNNFFYEGTGGRQSDTFHSSLRKVEVQSGKVVQKVDMDGKYFGEGITIFNDKIYQITWQEKKAFVYDVNDFKILKEFSYFGEGWGITHDAANLIMSDGTQVLRFINPENFQVVRTLVVTDEKGKEIDEINELEYVKGEIWANIWQEGWIARIDPQTGKLVGRIDLEDLAERQMAEDRNADVLNGIAYDEASDRLFVTGKKWRKIFEIKVKPKQ